jgi:hypothetical protein
MAFAMGITPDCEDWATMTFVRAEVGISPKGVVLPLFDKYRQKGRLWRQILAPKVTCLQRR